jgi:hypothetical protein
VPERGCASTPSTTSSASAAPHFYGRMRSIARTRAKEKQRREGEASAESIRKQHLRALRGRTQNRPLRALLETDGTFAVRYQRGAFFRASLPQW